jgi:CrcB protein
MTSAMTPVLLLLVALGGAAGAVVRYTLSGRIQERLGGQFPWGTAVVNVAGCLTAGLVTGLLAPGGPGGGGEAFAVSGGPAQALVLAGFLGAFTTFSGFAADGVRLTGAGHRRHAILYLAGSLAAGILAAAVGLLTGRLMG